MAQIIGEKAAKRQQNFNDYVAQTDAEIDQYIDENPEAAPESFFAWQDEQDQGDEDKKDAQENADEALANGIEGQEGPIDQNGAVSTKNGASNSSEPVQDAGSEPVMAGGILPADVDTPCGDCEVQVTHYASSPDIEAKNDKLVEAIGDLGDLQMFMTKVNVGLMAKMSLGKAIEVAAEEIFDSAMSPDAEKVAQIAREVFSKAHGRMGGWSLWTRIESQDGTRTEWMRYTGNTLPLSETYQTTIDAYGNVERACHAQCASLLE